MEPFNVKVKYGTNEITLTILPEEEGHYKIIYYGGVLGIVCSDGKYWEMVSPEKIIAGDLPFYEPGQPGERVEIELNDHLTDLIGEEIDLYFADEM